MQWNILEWNWIFFSMSQKTVLCENIGCKLKRTEKNSFHHISHKSRWLSCVWKKATQHKNLTTRDVYVLERFFSCYLGFFKRALRIVKWKWKKKLWWSREWNEMKWMHIRNKHQTFTKKHKMRNFHLLINNVSKSVHSPILVSSQNK